MNWLTREADIQAAAQVPFRLLEEAPDLSTGELDDGNIFIQGDNLEALKALLPFNAGQVKCIYIDPPFNTGQAFQHYDDNVEHSIWLGMMYARLELLRDLLAPTGTIVIHLNEFVLDNADRVVQPVPPAYDGVGQETRKMIDISRNNPNRVYCQGDIVKCCGW